MDLELSIRSGDFPSLGMNNIFAIFNLAWKYPALYKAFNRLVYCSTDVLWWLVKLAFVNSDYSGAFLFKMFNGYYFLGYIYIYTRPELTEMITCVTWGLFYIWVVTRHCHNERAYLFFPPCAIIPGSFSLSQ